MKWVISLPYYGAFLFDGSAEEAEEMRRHKARWEGEIARLRPATAEETRDEKVRLQRGDAYCREDYPDGLPPAGGEEADRG